MRAASVHSDFSILPYSFANNTQNYPDGIKGRNEVSYTQLCPSLCFTDLLSILLLTSPESGWEHTLSLGSQSFLEPIIAVVIPTKQVLSKKGMPSFHSILKRISQWPALLSLQALPQSVIPVCTTGHWFSMRNTTGHKVSSPSNIRRAPFCLDVKLSLSALSSD